MWDYLREVPRLQSVVHVLQGFQFVNENKRRGREVVSTTRQASWVRAVLRAADDYDITGLPKAAWIDPAPKNIRTPGPLKSRGIPQVMLNYAPIAREPWRLKAAIDYAGIAFSSRFLAFRPKRGGPSLRALWAILNSPVANAYAYCFSGKRETLVKEWRALPLPNVTLEHALSIEGAAAAYLAAMEANQTSFMQTDSKDTASRALLALDAEILKLYDLPPRLERQLLDLFKGVERKGVGCDFRGYYPSEFRPCIPLHEYISEGYQRSTAGNIASQFEPVRSKAALAALDMAEELAAGE